MKNTHIVIYVVIVLISLSTRLFGQSQHNLSDIFKSFNNNKYYSTDIILSSESEKNILMECTKQLYSDNIYKKQFAYKIINKTIIQSTNSAIQIQGTFLLCQKGLREKELSIVYYNLINLLDLPSSYFDKICVNIIKTNFFNKSSYYSLLVRLLGNLPSTQTKDALKYRINNKEKFTHKEIWNMRLALAKQGDIRQQEYCMDKLKSVDINDDIIFTLIPDLIYIKNKKIFDYLFDEILKNNTNCTSLNPDNEVSISCSYRLIELIAPYIIDFPVKLGFSGDLEVDNYPKMLKKIREWIIVNKNIYQIK